MIRIGIDIGGTFTDFAVWRDSAQGYTNITSFKVPSTPPTFADAVRTGLDEIIETEGIAPDEEILLVHGTTVSTNAVIERSGPPMALFVTKGFGDLLNIQLLRLDKPIDMFNRRTTPLVAREHVFEIDERLLSDGAVERALPADEVAAAAAAARASAAGAEAVAICFLHSYRNPAHEIAAREVVATRGNGLAVTLSSEIWPQQNEYERAVVAVLNGYVKKIIADYIGEIETYLRVRLEMNRVFSGSCETAREELDAGEEDPGLGGLDGRLEVLGQPPVSIEPGERALDDPSAGQELEALHARGTVDDLQRPAADPLQCALELGPGIGAVGEDVAQAGKVAGDGGEHRRRAVAVLDLGAVDHDRDQQAAGVGEDVTLAALDFLSGVEAPDTAAFRGFYALTVDDTGRRAGRAALGLARRDQQLPVDLGPGAVVPPEIKVALHRRAWREVPGQHAPWTAATQ